MENNAVTRTEYLGQASFGTISKNTTNTIEYTPDAPRPWKARKMMSWFIDCAAPQAPDEMVKTARQAMSIVLRPTVSLILANITMNAV